MNVRETRLSITRWPTDVLYNYAVAIFKERTSSYPRHKDKSGQVQWLIEQAQRLVKEREVEYLGNVFNSQVRELLIQGFSDNDVYRFMYDSPTFHTIALELNADAGKGKLVDALIAHTNQYPEKWEYVFDWMRETNPSRYTRHLLSWQE